MKALITAVRLILVTTAAFHAMFSHAGPRDGGGGLPEKINAEVIEILFKQNYLKKAMMNYLSTIRLDQVATPSVQSMFKDFLKDERLQKDILTEGNYVITSGCRDLYDNRVAASAVIGELGGKICFDKQALAQELRGLSTEEGMIRLASLAFHEHAHHLQSKSKSLIENEKAAYEFSAYIQLTAKTVSVPLLQWSIESQMTSDCMMIKGTYKLDKTLLSTIESTGWALGNGPAEFYRITTRGKQFIQIEDNTTSKDQYAYPSIINFVFDNKTHVTAFEKKPNPVNNYKNEYIAHCTNTGFVISESATDHSGADGYPRTGSSQQIREFSFDGNILTFTSKSTSYDLNLSVLGTSKTSIKYVLAK